MQGIATLPYEVHEQPLIPEGGLQTMKSAAEMLAEFGRNGDTYIVHAAEGETMVPMEVLDENPKLKNMLFAQMEEMGIEPERYIVGNELNSINPVTGQPEFFFKKIFKKIARGVKKVVKKIAPVVLPIALSFALGPIYGAGLGSGITTLLQGGSLKDAAKSALISGGIGALGAGFTGNQGSFLKNIQFAAGSPLQAAAQQRASFAKLFGGDKAVDPTATAKAGTTGTDAAGKVVGKDALGGDIVMPEGQNLSLKQTGGGSGTDKSLFEKYVYDPAPATVDPTTGAVSGEGTLESIFSPSRASIDPALQTQIAKGEAAKALSTLGDTALDEAAKKAITDKASQQIAEAATAGAPGFLKQSAPLLYAGAGVAGAAALAGYKDEDDDGVDDYTGLTLDEYKQQYPDRFFGDDFYGNNPYYQDPTFLTQQAVTAARGGAINGPGTSTSDSIPAMLSDGEFVMNAKAVRGAGGGDRKAGAQRMYDMMRKFERMG
jgi:hypothetical protein|tara:strand:+ start:4164 stop:5630 length:1467 start_codon:yes stop_codon:yes gene_type:complete